MVLTYYCDFCKAKLGDEFYIVKITKAEAYQSGPLPGVTVIKKDACKDCADKVLAFIEGRRPA